MKLLLKYFFISVLLFSAYFSKAQTVEEYVIMGDESFSDADFYSAAVYFHNALTIDSSDIYVAYKYADACRLFNNYKEAEHWYGYVIESAKAKDFPLCRFWYALMNKSNGKYNEASENFKQFIESYKTKDDYFSKKAKIEVIACQEAKKITDDKLSVKIDHLAGTRINTSFSEFNARQIGDNDLYFSSLRPVSEGDFETFIPNAYISKIYTAKNSAKGWTNIKEFDPKINDKETHNANITFSKNHKKLYFTKSKVDNNPTLTSEIYTSEFKDGKWQKPVNLGNNINLTGYTSTQPHIYSGSDYDALYFASDRPGGFGKMDIWYSIVKDGKYGDPINCGSIINTMGDEVTPYYYEATNTLYFSSDWHKGLGGFDIFKSKGGLSDWSTPENIGYPINTSYNDLYFTINEVDKDGYFTSNRPGSIYIKSETCCNDIYYYEWKEQPKQVTVVQEVKKDSVKIEIEETIKLLLPLTLYFHNDEPDPRSTNITTSKNYKTSLADYYSMESKYKEEYSKGLSGKEKTKAENDIKDFFENYVAKGFSNLQLFSELLLLDLEKGSHVSIKIKGYCSPLNTSEYNLNLAKRRIMSLKNYMAEYNDGVFIKYLEGKSADSGRLRILEDPIGKALASPYVSDNPNDQRNSVYSRAAALERKIQIILYESEGTKAGSDTAINYPGAKFEKLVYDFGNIKKGEKVSKIILYENTGDGNLIIQGIETSSNSLSVDWSQSPVPPGGRGKIVVNFFANTGSGVKTETCTILSNTKKGKDMLTITAKIPEK
jgi:hypothetical protein